MSWDSTNSIKLGGIECWDIKLSFSFDDGVTTAKREMRVAWNDLGRFVDYMRGSNSSGAGILINPVAQSLPGYSNMTCVGVTEVEGIVGKDGATNPTGTLISYHHASLLVNYSTKNFGFASEDLRHLKDFSITNGYEKLLLPAGAILVGGVPTTIPTPITTQLRTINITRVGYREIPFEKISIAELNPVNKFSMPIFGISDPHLVIYDGSSTRENPNANGLIYQDVAYQFKARPYSWNKAYPATPPTSGPYIPVDVTFADGTTPVYAESDLNELLS